jgi:hypothetical protein
MEPEVITPDQQPKDPGQQAPTSSPPQDDYKPRYDGAVRKIQELTETLKGLQGQLGEKSSTLEQLQGQLSSKDAEIDAVKGQYETQVTAIKTEFDQAKTELTKLKALQTKLEVANELGHPELMRIFDTIPDVQDKDTIKKTMETVLNFSTSQVRAREQELTAGTTPSPGTTTITMPKTQGEWIQRISNMPEDSKERKQAWDAYFEWAKTQ